ncbi:unnamed protein product [Adineta steineri]|uniref:Uncharacterized protein n=1 Tax=Adineta steineri TaxID=433720 RepID=A0A819UK21_9BILA|nr:unnamed protein product [Adineta steineri]
MFGRISKPIQSCSLLVRRNLAAEIIKDGLMPATAITLQETNVSVATQTEHKWLNNKYPGYTLKSKAMVTDSGKYLDRFSILTKDGQQQNIYFDITQCYACPLSDLKDMFNKQHEPDKTLQVE